MVTARAEIQLPDWLAGTPLPIAPASDEACMRFAIALARDQSPSPSPSRRAETANRHISKSTITRLAQGANSARLSAIALDQPKLVSFSIAAAGTAAERHGSGIGVGFACPLRLLATKQNLWPNRCWLNRYECFGFSYQFRLNVAIVTVALSAFLRGIARLRCAIQR